MENVCDVKMRHQKLEECKDVFSKAGRSAESLEKLLQRQRLSNDVSRPWMEGPHSEHCLGA